MKYKVGDKVRIKSLDWYNENKDEFGVVLIENGEYMFFESDTIWCGKVITIVDVCLDEYYTIAEDFGKYRWTDEMIEGLEREPDMGEVSDGYHTFNELYEYRLLYNASMFNELAKQNLYDVHKSKRHSDGEIPFGDPNWFIVMAELPTGQISNHYEMKDWDLFQIPEKETANTWDGHTPKDVAERLRKFLTPKSKYPMTYAECCKVLSIQGSHLMLNAYKVTSYEKKLYTKIKAFSDLMVCKDAYWKIAGEKMGLDKPWEPDWDSKDFKFIISVYHNTIDPSDETTHRNTNLAFPTAEMRDAFYVNFRELIEDCKDLL